MSDKIRQKDKNNISVYIQGGEKKVMTKFNKKMINVLATATLVAGVAAPIAALTAPTAIHAASSYTNLSNPSISSSAQDDATLGRTRMVITQASIAAGASFTVTLPKGFEFSGAGNGVGRVNSATDATYGLGVYLDAGDNNLAKNADSTGYNDANAVEVTKLTDNSARVQLNFSNSADDATLYLNFGKVDVTGPANGPIKVAIDAASASGLTSGEAVIGNVVSSGQISLSAADTVSSEENFTATLKVKEETAGSLGKNNIKLKLPSGFKWDSAPKSEATILFGTDIKPANVKYSADGDTLTLSLDKVSGQQTSFQLPVGFYVDDETSAKEGDVTVSISGNATTDVSSLVVGSYGQIGGGVSVATPTTILAGHDEQKIGDIVIKETVAKSFVNGRTVTLRLPEGARWQSTFESNNPGSSFSGSMENTNGLGGADVSYTDSDKRTLKLTFKNVNSTTDAGTLKLKNVEVATQPGFSGDLNVEVAGSQGLSGNVKVATVKQAVTLAAASKPTLTIGLGDQQVGDITITEAAKEAFVKKDGSREVILELPTGVRFASTPEVKVTAGDVKVKSVSTDTYGESNKGRLSFYIDSESATPSTITISAPKLTVDRTVAQGDIVAKLKGSAVSYTAYKGATDNTQNWKDNNTAAAEVAIATVGTPAPGATKTKAVFTLGSTSYTVNGETKTADVAAYAENGRTYLPVRYAAEALGVSPQNILFDKATSTVTLIKGDRVAQIKLNTNLLTVNGSVIRMDVKAVTNKNRTVLPIFWVSRALDASINYDATAKTVTVENNN
ncbi:copper amine oxidase N-terminal domain-containing protein [Paenibacillus sp. P2(2022)]|uniref:copper amine oxidase N-terminal domain-containing protein n=1 Tax=Paenibacillus TaxID=44249 RepID=UPI0005EC4041|nr:MULTISPECIES: copper amine oxidase N-terminal domain-containing protein [Paenibacillus]KJK29972.1 copper amine oxidase [Paenibacillus polymyxa]MDG0054466.1 copper amine oxidase N-terminal domain-containing protein [Paenibacillus sp. P2(2022)]WOZ38078.1 copper amine oxidase N-terminal domain-containing protein [Paenibacillus polymyxa]SEJ24511.1 Copper amine oxidase N-terminal domain-containing protein [Paenibacillus polymyxa]